MMNDENADERDRILAEIELLEGAIWLIKDRRTVQEACEQLQRAADNRKETLRKAGRL